MKRPRPWRKADAVNARRRKDDGVVVVADCQSVVVWVADFFPLDAKIGSRSGYYNLIVRRNSRIVGLPYSDEGPLRMDDAAQQEQQHHREGALGK